ncbi:MAG TPA: co-chaperone DjlA [Xanthomonadales bacterium]|nr:co-chaperone DjlA [Xanthomonadales bacterium]
MNINLPRFFWGKLIGGILGLLRGGITGAVLGALFGHMVDRFFQGIAGVKGTQEAFFEALFCSLGYLAKADGQVSPAEIQMVESLMQRMQISGEDRQRAIRFFNQGKQPGFKLHAALGNFSRMSLARRDLRQMFLQIMVEAAFSSDGLTAPEQDVLEQIARELHIPASMLTAMLQARQFGGSYSGTGGNGQRTAGGVQRGTLPQAYAQLGLTTSASDAEVKKAYRKLVSQYHPDKLVSRGLPEEMMDMAKNRVRDINTAYEQIKQAKGIK